MEVKEIYLQLLTTYKEQHWWPGDTPFEIMLGAVLTQSVSWTNVEKAISQLKQRGLLDPHLLDQLTAEEIAPIIKSTGYYNQKARKIKNLLCWLASYDYDICKIIKRDGASLRQELLQIKGIGPETADSILLYALDKKYFVVDAYTRRIFSRLGQVTPDVEYHQLQQYLTENFNSTLQDYNEFHALLVQLAKLHCLKSNPLCHNCPLGQVCLKKF